MPETDRGDGGDEHTRKRHPIRVVARRTGLSPARLRAWERRYDLVEPARSHADRRLYSDADIERLRLLSQAVQAGRRIGQVAGLSTEKLAELVREDRVEAVRPETADGWMRPGDPLEAALDAVADLDARRLEEILGRATVALGAEGAIDRVLGPLLDRIGEAWCAGEVTPGHEHLASAVVQRVLGDLILEATGPTASPTLVVGTPAGTHHEFGGMFAALIAVTEGWSVAYLGPDLPAADIAAVVRETGARATALSLVYPSEAESVRAELRALREALPEPAPIFVGGRASASYQDTLRAIGARRPASLPEFRAALSSLR